MKSLREIYRTVHACAETDVTRRLFWRSLPRRALPLAPFVLLLRPRYFAGDREMIESLTATKSVTDFNEELRYFVRRRRSGWWRRTLGLRVSASRLAAIAAEYLLLAYAESAGTPSGQRRQSQLRRLLENRRRSEA